MIDAARRGAIKEAAIALGFAVLAGVIGFWYQYRRHPAGRGIRQRDHARRPNRAVEAVNKQESKNGLSYDYAFMWSYGFGETLTLAVPDAAGGGVLNTPEIGDNSKFVDRAAQELNMPEETALQYANGYAYWGPQPFTSGPVYLGAVICFLAIFALVLLKGWLKWGLLATIVSGHRNGLGESPALGELFPVRSPSLL